MKKGIIAVTCMAVAVSFAVTASAAAPAAAPAAKSSVTLNYWMAKVSDGDVTGSNTAKQNYLPDFALDYAINPEWGVVAGYDRAGAEAITPPIVDTKDTLKSTRYVIGVKHAIPGTPAYGVLSYQNTTFDISTTIGAGSVKSKGPRIAVGAIYKMQNSPVELAGEIGYGISNKAYGGGDSTKSNHTDLDLHIGYPLPYAGLKANLGYKYINMKQKASPTWGTAGTTKVKGIYVGVTYALK